MNVDGRARGAIIFSRFSSAFTLGSSCKRTDGPCAALSHASVLFKPAHSDPTMGRPPALNQAISVRVGHFHHGADARTPSRIIHSTAVVDSRFARKNPGHSTPSGSEFISSSAGVTLPRLPVAAETTCEL